jgi:hypothetical protein
MAAQFYALGKLVVAVAGTPQPVVPPPAMNPPSCHAVIIEALPGNTGKIYIGLLGLDKTTYAQVLVVLPIPTANLIPTFSIALTVAGNAVNLGNLFIDADVGGEGVLISALVA